MSITQRMGQAFTAEFSRLPARWVRAPGRVNLIGEHTDYNDGFVLPMAIDRSVRIAFQPRDDQRVVVRSLDFDERSEFTLESLDAASHAPQVRRNRGWFDYVQGIAWAIQRNGRPLRGWQGVIAGDVPIGAGLSSSAAVELAVARVFAAVSELQWNAFDMATIAQQAEVHWVGLRCGVMDQMIVAAGRAGNATLIDCRSLDLLHVPIPAGTVIVVLDTNTRRGLVESAYNQRRDECDQAADALGVNALRDIALGQLTARADALDPILRKRAFHVVSENARTLAAADAMRRDDAQTLGRLMVESHRSLRDDYEVSCSELDAIVAAALKQPGCHGARMTGAGFGGCAVALVDETRVDAFVVHAAEAYRNGAAIDASIYIVRPSDGAQIVEIEQEAH